MSERFAAIDVGTNTVLLVVAERSAGGFTPVAERAEITRLGRGVDASGLLAPEAIRETVAVVARFAAEARTLGARAIACVATSAARDAANGAAFFDAARADAGLSPEVISGEEEARLVYRSAWRDFGLGGAGLPAGLPLAVLDVGGGSTEFTWGDGSEPRGRRSLQLGAVRLTERHPAGDPPGVGALAALRAAAAAALAPALRPLEGVAELPGARLVGVAGTVTTLAAVEQALPAYDAARVHGSTLSLDQVEALCERMAAMTLAARRRLPGMEPKRADVILAGGAVISEAMRATGFDRLVVSDRGVRWGLLHERFGGA